MTRQEEYKLLQSLGQGDKKAFSMLYTIYAGKCYQFVSHLSKDEEVAKDIVHDIFVKIWLKREIVSQVDSFSSYLFKMTRNAVMDKFESDAIRARYQQRKMLDFEESALFTEEKISVDELQLLIYEAMEKMPDRRKDIFFLSRIKGLSNTEIAVRLGLNVRTVENHISKALADIRVLLEESYI